MIIRWAREIGREKGLQLKGKFVVTPKEKSHFYEQGKKVVKSCSGIYLINLSFDEA